MSVDIIDIEYDMSSWNQKTHEHEELLKDMSLATVSIAMEITRHKTRVPRTMI